MEIKIDEFISFCELTKNLSAKTLTAYRQDLSSYEKYSKETENADPLGYISHLFLTKHRTATVKRHLATLSQYFKFAYRNNRLANPMLQYDFKIKSEKLLPRTISVYEVKKLFRSLSARKTAAKTDFARSQIARDMALLDLLCSTGMRIGEAAALKLSDLDLRTRIVLVHGKGRKERLLYLSCEETVNNLKEWLALRKEYSPDNDYLFLNRYMQPISIHGIEDIFKKYRRLANVRPCATPHYLRHTFATNLLANGSDIRSVQELLGHSSISITERYTEVTTSRKIKVLKKFNYRNTLSMQPTQ